MAKRMVPVLLTAVAGLGVAALALSREVRAHARAAESRTDPEATHSAAELTVYAQDFALVKEARPVRLAAGNNHLAFPDVSRELDPHSVLLRWQGEVKDQPEIVGHSYDLGVQDSQTLLKQEVGSGLEVVRYSDAGKEASREPGRLLATDNGGAIVEVDGKVYVNPPGTLVFPKDVAAIPQLTVETDSSAARSATLDLAYLTRGLSWSADYVATLSRAAEDRMDLECYATVTNHTGVRFPNASLTLVAGTPNRAVTPAPMRRANVFEMNAELKAIDGVPAAAPAKPERWSGAEAPEAVGDQQQYSLRHPATIRNEELNRLLMLRRADVKIHRDYSYRAPALEPWSSPQQDRGNVTMGLSFQNTKEEAIGEALPAGTLRVYEPDSSNRLRYAGASDVRSTPKGQKINATLSNAFDLTARYRTVESHQIGKHVVRKKIEVRINNQRAKQAAVRVVQGFFGGWTLVNEDLPHTKANSNLAEWSVPVPASGEKVLSFTVDLKC